MSNLLLTAGDTAPALTGICRDGDTVASLVGATVTVHIERPVADLVSRVANVTDASGGAWSLDWEEDDLVDVGVYLVEVEVVFADTRRQTFGPDNFTVQDQLA